MGIAATSAAALDEKLNPLEITAAQSWKQQIEGLYALLFPYIARDFRLNTDCSAAHVLPTTPSSPEGHLHKLPQPKNTSATRIGYNAALLRVDLLTYMKTRLPILEIRIRTKK